MSKQTKKTKRTNPYLGTDKSHKDWYEIGAMGKQRGKPKAVPPKVKKTKGEFKKHSH